MRVRSRWALSLLSCFWLFGCGPGGGGSIQRAPDTVRAGEPAVVTLELSVWGSGGSIAGRYTDVVLFHRLVGEQDFAAVRPTVVSRDETQEVYEFAVPPYPPGTSGEIEYYIELTLDGHPSRIDGINRIGIE